MTQWSLLRVPIHPKDPGETLSTRDCSLGHCCRKCLPPSIGRFQRFGSLIGSDPLMDIFAFLSRHDLDVLQLVDARFNAVVATRMNATCFRRLSSAEVKRSNDRKQYVVVVKFGRERKEKGVELPIGVTAKSDAFDLLLRACRNAFVQQLNLYGTAPIGSADLDAMARHAPLIRLNTLFLGSKELAADIPSESVFNALNCFAALEKVIFLPSAETPRMQNWLLSNAHRLGVAIEMDRRGRAVCPPIDEESLMQYCFGVCAENCGACTRRLYNDNVKLSPLFLQRWIEVRAVKLPKETENSWPF